MIDGASDRLRLVLMIQGCPTRLVEECDLLVSLLMGHNTYNTYTPSSPSLTAQANPSLSYHFIMLLLW